MVGTEQVVYTDVDGRYVVDLSPGTHQIRVAEAQLIERKQAQVIADNMGAAVAARSSACRYTAPHSKKTARSRCSAL